MPWTINGQLLTFISLLAVNLLFPIFQQRTTFKFYSEILRQRTTLKGFCFASATDPQRLTFNAYSGLING